MGSIRIQKYLDKAASRLPSISRIVLNPLISNTCWILSFKQHRATLQ